MPDSCTITTLAAIEWNKSSRDELLTPPWRPQCCYTDIFEFVEKRVRKNLVATAAKMVCHSQIPSLQYLECLLAFRSFDALQKTLTLS